MYKPFFPPMLELTTVEMSFKLDAETHTHPTTVAPWAQNRKMSCYSQREASRIEATVDKGTDTTLLASTGIMTTLIFFTDSKSNFHIKIYI